MALHPRLEEDCHRLGLLADSMLLLHRNASLPWFLLVPETDATALYSLPAAQRQTVEGQWNEVASWVHSRFDCLRVNMAAIGNIVPQLHLHVIGRREGDPCWPDVVWGQKLPDARWSAAQLDEMRKELGSSLNLSVS